MKTGDCFKGVAEVRQELQPKQAVVVRHEGGKVIIYGEPRVPGHPNGSEDLKKWQAEAENGWPNQVEVVYGFSSRKIGDCREVRFSI